MSDFQPEGNPNPEPALSSEVANTVDGNTDETLSSTDDLPLTAPIRNFLAGALLSGLPIWVYLSMSVWMTQDSLAAAGAVRLGVAIAIPLAGGLAGVAFKDRVLKQLTALTDVILPF